MPDRPLVIAACGARKASTPRPAGELYTGSYHQACRRAAAAMTTPDRTLILSAKYGLLRLGDWVEPYEMRLGDAGAVYPELLLYQATTLLRLPLDEQPIALCGRAYTALVRAVWPQASAPLAGTRGIGEQLALLRAMRGPPYLSK